MLWPSEPTLLRSERRLAVERLGAHLSTIALIHPRFRVHIVDNARVISEDALSLRAFDRVGATGRPTCTILLAGQARISAFGAHHELVPGDALLVAHKQSICMRQEGDPYRAVVLEWDPGSLGPLPITPVESFPVLPATMTALHALTSEVIREQPPQQTVAHVLEQLVASGFPFGGYGPADLVHELPPRMGELSQALDEVLSLGGVRPTTVDLEERMGLSTRQLNRLVESYHTTYGFNSEGWRDTVKRRRIMLGASLMTAPGASVIEVSQSIGFSSAEAFARALGEAGLPPPSEIRDEVMKLGALASASSGSSGAVA